MSTKPANAALPPILAEVARSAPPRPALLTWLCLASCGVGILGLMILAIDLLGLLAVIAGPSVSPPSTRISPLVKVDQAKKEELELIRSHFLLPSLAAAAGLFAKSLALLIGGFAALAAWSWGRITLSWTFRLGGLFLLLWLVPYSLQMAYEIPTVAKYLQLARDTAAQNSALLSPLPWSNATYLAFAYGWMTLVIGWTLAQAAICYFGWRYLESDDIVALFEAHEATMPDRTG